jgi:hypothetical protein
MSKSHTFYWILAVVALVMLWAARRAIVKSREMSARKQQREEEFLTQFPEFAGALDGEQRRSR